LLNFTNLRISKFVCELLFRQRKQERASGTEPYGQVNFHHPAGWIGGKAKRRTPIEKGRIMRKVLILLSIVCAVAGCASSGTSGTPASGNDRYDEIFPPDGGSGSGS
jgi:hypothetical protein